MSAAPDKSDEGRSGQIIVGHAGERMAKIWVLAPKNSPFVTLTWGRNDKDFEDRSSDHLKYAKADEDCTLCFVVGPLDPSTEYKVEVRFSNESRHSPGGHAVSAKFKTSPNEKFSFVLGSCNLSNVAINNLAVQATLLGGSFAAKRSLERPVSERAPPGNLSSKTRFFDRIMRWGPARRLVSRIVQGCVSLVFLATGGKWFGQPMIKSPFRKLTGLFDGLRIEFSEGDHEPRPEELLIGAESGAKGVVAFAPVVQCGAWRGSVRKDAIPAKGFLVLSEVSGEFKETELLLANRGSRLGNKVVARLDHKEAFCAEGLSQPAFTIHAGDQIYYDVPFAGREPDLDSYRDSYREAWFEDRFIRSFLSKGAHYMTLDDHEIVDNFSLPEPGWKDKERFGDYVGPASTAYREYVQNRSPGAHNDPEKLYYDFTYGGARFFVTDTRTQRCEHENSRMIGDDQMEALKAWLEVDHKDTLKFVVSSVPFVAELKLHQDGSREEDKWCGRPFRWQRDEIIDFIEEKKIDGVVFLVGDMHCSYHASLAIGDRHRWTRRTVHELAGGPINQLQFGERKDFRDPAALITRVGKIPYEVRLHQFHGGAGAVMHVEVSSAEDPRAMGKETPQISWRVVRTMTDPDVVEVPDLQGNKTKLLRDFAPISGRIDFARKRHVDQLQPW